MSYHSPKSPNADISRLTSDWTGVTGGVTGCVDWTTLGIVGFDKGCNRLELYEFTGDDDCPLFRDEQIEINEKGEIKWA